MEHFEKKEDDLHGRWLPWEMNSITGNQQSIIKYENRSSAVKPKFWIQLLDLTQPQQESYFVFAFTVFLFSIWGQLRTSDVNLLKTDKYHSSCSSIAIRQIEKIQNISYLDISWPGQTKLKLDQQFLANYFVQGHPFLLNSYSYS